MNLGFIRRSQIIKRNSELSDIDGLREEAN